MKSNDIHNAIFFCISVEKIQKNYEDDGLTAYIYIGGRSVISGVCWGRGSVWEFA